MKMSCDRCKELNVEYRITTPTDLRQAIRMVGESVADGTLREIDAGSNAYCSIPFSDLVNGAGWDDFVSYDFQCCHCGQGFHLGAETYHGSGGAWRPGASNAAAAL